MNVVFNSCMVPSVPFCCSFQIDSSTIDGNVKFVHYQYNCISVFSRVNLVFVSDKIINNSDNFRIKCLSYSKINAILFFIFWFYTFLFDLGKPSFSLLYLTPETPVYNWFISMLPPIVLDNLFCSLK